MIRRPRTTLTTFVAALALGALGASAREERPRITTIDPAPQRAGDPTIGREYLLTGDSNGSGMPRVLFDALGIARNAEPKIQRDGPNSGLPHSMTAFTDAHGVEVVAMVNCLACHAQELNGRLVVGLGNSLADWTEATGIRTEPLRAMAGVVTKPDSPEREAFLHFIKGGEVLAGRMHPPFKGVTPAFRFEELAASARDPETLEWADEHVYEPNPHTFASDVPPWWHLKKKNALYYNAIGRGDFATLLQQIGVVGIKDDEQADDIARRMPDLVAYLRTLEPPKFPGKIDMQLARAGERVFAANCADCHGTYDTFTDAPETYPNKLVPIDIVGTDPEYARSLVESPFHDWYNESWFAKSGKGSYAKPTMAYIAPPLDGIWATAPYLHNGSVPRLSMAIDSTSRPTYWRRPFDSRAYDLNDPGWRFTEPDGPVDTNTYDTTKRGYGNRGHTFGDDLTDDQRRALLEYLKTL